MINTLNICCTQKNKFLKITLFCAISQRHLSVRELLIWLLNIIAKHFNMEMNGPNNMPKSNYQILGIINQRKSKKLFERPVNVQ
jgi:hypothetical protein